MAKGSLGAKGLSNCTWRGGEGHTMEVSLMGKELIGVKKPLS